MAADKNSRQAVCSNRRALRDYFITDSVEAGLSLLGPEAKSLRLKQVKIEHAFARILNGQAVLFNAHIAPYAFNTAVKAEPMRERRLLLKKKEIKRLAAFSAVKGNALVPLEIYFIRGWAKIKLGLCKGKQAPDKRETIKKRDIERQLRRI